MQTSTNQSNNYIFIDASYFIFFRLHAFKNWWLLSHPELNDNETKKEANAWFDPETNPEFAQRFEKLFVEKLREIPRKLGFTKKNKIPYRVFVGKDCRRNDIWRMKHYPEYKGKRPSAEIEGKYFQIVYQKKLFEKAFETETDTENNKCILEYPSLEADDVIALSVKHLINISEDTHTHCQTNNCYIITSDMDYMQLCHPQVHIYDLRYKDLKSKNPAYYDASQVNEMFLIKRICGDKSDNIPAVFTKCGRVAAKKLATLSEEERISELMKKGGESAISQYKLNNLLMNFECIPDDLAQGFIQKFWGSSH